MPAVFLRFYAELNDFLPPRRRFVRFEWRFEGELTVAQALEQLGVPPDAVDLVLADGESVGLSRPLRDGERVSLFPVFERFDIGQLARVRARPLRQTRFSVEAGLERLAVYLRALGFDAVCGEPGEGRILVTRAPERIRDSGATHGVAVGAATAFGQLLQIVDELHLLGSFAPLRLCPRCDVELEHHGEAATCPRCRRAFREGPYLRLARRVERELER